MCVQHQCVVKFGTLQKYMTKKGVMPVNNVISIISISSIFSYKTFFFFSSMIPISFISSQSNLFYFSIFFLIHHHHHVHPICSINLVPLMNHFYIQITNKEKVASFLKLKIRLTEKITEQYCDWQNFLLKHYSTKLNKWW